MATRGRPPRPTLVPFFSAPAELNAVYLLEICNGLVKIGRSDYPRRRLQDIKRFWKKRGVDVGRFVVRDCFRENNRDIEAQCLKAFARQADPVLGLAEYFHHNDFNAAVEAFDSILQKQAVRTASLITAHLRELGAIAAELGADIVDAGEGFSGDELLIFERGYFEQRFQVGGQSLVSA